MIQNRPFRPLVRNLVIPALLFLFVASCAVLSKPSNTDAASTNCIGAEKVPARKTELETGIRGKVKFLEEPEDLSSIASKMSEYDIPALSLAVISAGDIEWGGVYQNPAFYQDQTLDCTSLFQAASLSKPVTFLAAVRMQAADEIDLDKNIQDYLKDYVLPEGKQTAENPITFRNLFSHTSGISAGGYEGYNRSIELPSDQEILQGAAGVNSPAIAVITSPNETLAYSGGGYTLAELALQDIYQQEFESIMRKWVLEPIGMDNSDFAQPLPASSADRIAKGHTQSGEQIQGGWHNYPEQAAAGLWTNAVDMAKFLVEIYKGYQGESTLFSQTDVKSILSHERDGHVYGFIVNRSGDDISITHYGGNAGYRTGMTISLTSGNGLVYLINSDNGGALGNELLLSAAQVYDWKHFEQTTATREQVSLDELKELAGAYKWNDQVDVSITYSEENKQISLIFPNGDAYQLTPIKGGELDFIHSNTGVRLAFLEANNFESFTLYGGTAVKLPSDTGSNNNE